MNGSTVNCPDWLAERIISKGGCVSFHQYMDWALNDPTYGAYSSGNLRIGPQGDFATSPSLGSDFAELLARQLVDWFEQIQVRNVDNLPLSLIEVGPGEGDLAFDLVRAIEKISPATMERLEIILVDINQGMIDKQKEKLSNILNIKIRWSSFEELADKPVIGVILAHEVLDALPVERVVLQNKKLFRQGVALDELNSTLYYNELPLTKNIEDHLLEYERQIGIKIPPEGASEGWSSEIHIEKNSWLKKASETLVYGALLIIDYALESNRYYNHLKNNGTIIAYKKQSATSSLLCEPGFCDLTTHLCIEALIFFAKKNKWQYLGSSKQGEALLSLGLALRLYSLQKLPSNRLDVALQRREALLRLVDPYGLGGFRWFAFEIDNSIGCVQQDPTLNSMFLIAPSE